MNRAKEKNRKSTKEKKLLDLDNEIIIGIKTLPTPEKPKQKRTSRNNKNKKLKKGINRKNKSRKDSDLEIENIKNGRTRPNSSSAKKKNTTRTKKEEEFELKLGIEDETIKRKSKKKRPSKTTKQQEIAKKKRKHIFRIIKWTSLVVIILGGGIAFLLSPTFNIKSITTSGNEKITSEELISLSGIKEDENIFKISNKKVEKNIKENAYIDSINVKRKLPDGVELQVVERKPAYMITLGNAYVYMNTQGYLLEISKEALKLPIIVGLSTTEEQIEVGNRLCAEDLQKLNSVIQIINSASSNEIANIITKINIADKQDYVLEFKSEKKTAHLGDTSNLSTKMLYIKSIINKEKKKEGDIFFNSDLSNKGATFREKV